MRGTCPGREVINGANRERTSRGRTARLQAATATRVLRRATAGAIA
jgi:hypothetical protein